MVDTLHVLVVGIVDRVLLVLFLSNVSRRVVLVVLGTCIVLFMAACGSEAADQAQALSVAPTSLPTTPPLSAPTVAPAPAPTALPTAAPTPTSVPTALPTPTAVPTSPTVAAAPSATAVSEAAPAEVEPTVEAIAEPTAVVETPTVVPTPLPTPTVAEPDPTPTPLAETPTPVVVVSGEPPLECYDAIIKLYRGFVEGVDALAFEGGRVFCGGAASSTVTASRSYRHSSGLVVQRNANYIFNDEGTAYIPYSGAMHFCTNGQPASAPIVADTVPALLVVIDNEARVQIAQDASGPTTFTSSGATC